MADGEGVEKARANYENIGKSVDTVLKKNNEFKPLFDQLNEQLDDASMNLYKFTDAFNKQKIMKKKYLRLKKNLQKTHTIRH